MASEMSAAMQKAAAQVEVNRGESLDTILDKYPHLEKGVALLKEEAEKAAQPRRVGTTAIRRSGIKPGI